VNSILPFVITGLTTGAIYALAASGLVLTYRTSGLFNFAHGAVAAAAAYVFYFLTVDLSMPWVPAFLVSVVGLGVVVGLVFEIAARQLVKRDVAMQIVATVGFILVVQSLAVIKYGPDPLQIEAFLPGSGHTFRWGGVNVGGDQVVIIGLSLILLTSLSAMMHRSRLGLSMRAVVDNDSLAGLHGTSAVQTRRIAWVIGSVLAAASGVLFAPTLGINAVSMTYLVVAAIGAAAFGGFSNLVLTGLGGLVIGVGAALSEKWIVGSKEWLSGVPQSVPFVVLVVALVVLPKRKLVSKVADRAHVVTRVRAPSRIGLPFGVIVLTLLIAVPWVVGSRLPLYMQGLTMAMMFLSLGLLVRTAGQVSLCHAAFAAIGAMGFSELVVDRHWPWLVGVVAAGVIVLPAAAVIAALAVRLNGLFLALATLAFGIMVESLVYRTDIGFTGTGRVMPRPPFADTQREFYFVVLGFVVAAALILLALERGRLGRMLRGVAEAPVAIRTIGLNDSIARAIVFCVSAFVAAIAGALYGCVVQYGSYGDAQFVSFQSLVLIAALALAPFTMPWFGLFGLLVAVLPGYLQFDDVTSWMNLLFGVFALATAIQGGVPAAPRFVQELFRRLTRAPRPISASGQAGRADLDRVDRAGDPGLELTGIEVRFGGLKAVDGVSLSAPLGRITGLIGPNGAGKTTTFNACTGLVRPQNGTVTLLGHDITDDSVQRRAQRGLGRSFQITQLCDSLSVRENVAMGKEAGLAGSNILTQFVGGRSGRAAVAESTDQALRACGLEALAETPAALLSTGERRLVEVARCLAGNFDVLLLDEPSAGLDRAESARLTEVLTSIVRERGCAILLVEHDMAMVMEACDYIYVLDFGKPLFEGTPVEVAGSPVVQAAYLGEPVDVAPDVAMNLSNDLVKDGA
jgi:ABC-type branched-subunit amino acid transport system ATPase component/branched-subunit amino acid ABC-type transport system permease component